MSEKIKNLFTINISGAVNLFLWAVLLTFYLMSDKFSGETGSEIITTTLYMFISILILNGIFYVILRGAFSFFKNGTLWAYLLSNFLVTTFMFINNLTVLVYGKQLGLEGVVMAFRGWKGGEMGDFTSNVIKMFLFIALYIGLYYLGYRVLERLLSGRKFNINVTMAGTVVLVVVTIILHFRLVAMADSGWKMSIIKHKIPWQSLTGFPEDKIMVDENGIKGTEVPPLFKNPVMLSEKTELKQILLLKEKSAEFLKQRFTARRKMNILFINVEGLRHDMITPSCMPHLYKFASERGFILKKHYSTGNNTPGSLFGMFTGLAPYYFEPLRKNCCPNMPLEVLKRLGYRQSIYYNSPKNYEYIYRDIIEKTEGRFVRAPGVKEDYAPREKKLVDRYLADIRHDSGAPRFDYYLFNVTHFNYYYPPEFRKYKPDFKMDFQIISGSQKKFRKHKQGLLNRYKNSVYYFDYLFNRLITGLKKAGRLKNTIIVLSGDHGEEFWEHGSFGHTWGLNNIQIQPGAFIYYPGISEDDIRYKYTSHQDFMPTVFDLIGLNADYRKFTTGKSLVDYRAEDDYAVASLGILTSFRRNGYAIMGNGYKILYKNNLDLNKSPYAIYDDNDKPVKEFDTYKIVDLMLKTAGSKRLAEKRL